MATMPHPPSPPTNPSRRPIGKTPPSRQHFAADSDSDSDAATPLAGSPTTPRYLPLDPRQQASQRILDQLRSALVEGYPSAGNYCCGGNIPISTHPPPSQDSAKAPIVSLPVTLRYDTTAGSASKLQFPPPDPEDEQGKDTQRVGIEDLLSACTTENAADDDSGSRDSRSESTARSAKLERGKFSVDFHPSDFGILDAIKQVLMPGAKFEGATEAKGKGKGIDSGRGNENWVERQEHWGVRAELQQLNVYSNISTRGLRPLSTPPRRGTHSGTLVVCLPYPHQGGDQVITHPSPSTHKHLLTQRPHSTHIPTSFQRPSISWVAYLRGSTHSILPITSGHVITLTYHLHMMESVGGPLQRYPTADPRLYPFYQVAKRMLENPDFMPEGGPLGIHCTHPYHHTRKSTQKLMPYCLRGIDAITFSVFRALGLKVLIGPILGDEAWDEWEQIREQKLVERIYSDDDEPMDEDDEEGRNGDKTRVGKAWHKLRMVGGEGGTALRIGGDPTAFINHHYPLHILPSVIWLNESSRNWEIAMVNLKHLPSDDSGSEETETDIMWQYSHAAIFVEIPSIEKRRER